MLVRLALFLLFNFGALAIGGIYTASGVTSDWYNQLNKAPWTPPGWVFGAAWTLIMVCLAVYMAYLYNESSHQKVALLLYGVQLVLNVVWNPLFFRNHSTALALVVIVLLTCLVIGLFTLYFQTLGLKSFLIMPYVVWLLIATSLNAYIVVRN